ncbi:MAG: BspA family leucine-rich repeat surface protein [Marinicella sp.]
MKCFFFIIWCLISLDVLSAPENDFVITVYIDVDNDTQFIIPTNPEYIYNYNIDCNNDGLNEAESISGDYTCDYVNEGSGFYTIRIMDNIGDGTGFPHFDSTTTRPENANKITALVQWGTGKWQSMKNSFLNAQSLEIAATDIPDLSDVTDMSSMFNNAWLANPDVKLWDVSNVESMASMFQFTKSADPDVSTWNTSSVIDMSFMFSNTELADPDVSNWNVSKVTNLRRMFQNARTANPDVHMWDVSSVRKMDGLFFNAVSATPAISSWDVNNVSVMNDMLKGVSLPPWLYDQVLINFNTLNLNNGVSFHAGDSFYCNGTSAKANIIDTHSWSIIDGDVNCGSDGSISITRYEKTIEPGQFSFIELQVSNTGFQNITNARVSTNFTDEHQMLEWTCEVLSGKSTCSSSTGFGPLSEFLDLEIDALLLFKIKFNALDLPNESEFKIIADIKLEGIDDDIYLPNNRDSILITYAYPIFANGFE